MLKWFGFLVLFLFLFLARTEGFRPGRQVYFDITIDFGSVPSTPATQVLLNPGGRRPYIINWNALRYDAAVNAQMSNGLCIENGLGDYNTYITNNDVQYFVLGNGELLDFVIQGPFWCSTYNLNPQLLGESNTTFDTYIMYDYQANHMTNPVFGYIPPAYTSQLDIFVGLTFYDIIRTGSWGFGNDTPEGFWGLFENFGSSASTLNIPPSMMFNASIPQIIYGPNNPLVIQYVTTDLTPPGTSTGSISFSIPVIFL